MLKKVILFLLAVGVVFSLANAHHETSYHSCGDEYIYNGYDGEGYDCEGYDHAGYDREGYDREGYDREGYDRDGYNRPGYNRNGYDRLGNDHHGFDSYGHDDYGNHYDPHGDYSHHERGVSHDDHYDDHDDDHHVESRSSRSNNRSSSRSSSRSNNRASARNAEILAYAYVNDDVNSVDLLNELVSSRSLRNLNCSDLRILRNEVFARYGWRFGVNTELSNYFDNQNWYQVAYPRISRTRNNDRIQKDVVNNPIAMENIKIIQAEERYCY